MEMGRIYTYRCAHCGYEAPFNQGHGYFVHSQPLQEYLDLRVKLFHYKTHRRLKQLAEKQGHLYIKASFQVYKCPHCQVLYDKVAVTVFNQSEVIHKSEFRCTACHARLKLTNIHRLKEATCPKCHRRTFHLENAHLQLWG